MSETATLSLSEFIKTSAWVKRNLLVTEVQCLYGCLLKCHLQIGWNQS